jgi:hypothetical protein
MSDKPNCYKCKWRGEVLGSAHSRCHHPVTGGEGKYPLAELMSIFGSVGRCEAVVDLEGAVKLGIKANLHGVEHGWFQWPYNFDPVWLEACEGFEAKEKDESV